MNANVTLLKKEFIKALLDVNRKETSSIFNSVAQMPDALPRIENLVRESLEEIGDAWEVGAASLAQVYMGGVICEELIDSFMSDFDRYMKHSRKIGMAVLLDQHSLGKRMVCSVLRAAGYNVTALGTGLTVEALVEEAIENNVEILLISALMLPSALKVKDVSEQLKKRGKNIKIVVGGAPFRLDNSLWEKVGADYNGKSASNIVEVICQIEEDMNKSEMTSLERTMAALGFQEADRVPLFLLLSLYGAKELNMTPEIYFSNADHVVEAQLQMMKKYRNDCLFNFFYAALEVEAFGGNVVFSPDGPPNAGEPCIKDLKDIEGLQTPNVKKAPGLSRVLETTIKMKAAVGDSVPIIGVVMSPFSLPIMQMGFDKYLELIYFNRKIFEKLMKVNEEFCIEWANAQIEAGATAICYFNPMSSSDMIEKQTYLSTGLLIDARVMSAINGPVAVHTASGRSLPVIEEIIEAGAVAIGFSELDDLNEMKKVTNGRICMLGNLNALEMVNWDTERVNKEVKNIIDKAGRGGGLILSDNHGEIPWQVPEQVLLDISDAVLRYGTYPLKEETGDE